MTETKIPWVASAAYFKVLCRLGINRPDSTGDEDSNPDLMSIGGTVDVRAAVTRFRYTEADGRSRMVTMPSGTYQIQASTGELFDADGNIGVLLMDSASPGVDPAGFTYSATVRPNIGEPWEVTFPGHQPTAIVDLVSAATVESSTGVSGLAGRVSVLEQEVEELQTSPGGSGGYPVQQVTLTGNLVYTLPAGAPTDQVVGVVFTQNATGGHTVTYGGSPVTVAATAGASTLVEFFHDGAGWKARVLTTTTPPDLSGYVPTSRTINGQALTGDITLDAADVGALPDTYDPDLSGYTPTSGLADVATSGSYADLSNKPTIPDSPDDVGAAAASHTHDDRYYTETEADALFAPAAQTINAQTGTTYTLVAADAGKLVTLTNSGAITLTVPADVFTAGQRVDCLVAGEGMVTVVGSGATVNGTPSLVSRAQYSAFTVLFTSATAAVVVGDLASA